MNPADSGVEVDEERHDADLLGHVLITGASRGIGKAVATRLAALGYDLVLWARSVSDLGDLANQTARLGRDVRVAAVDVADQDVVAAAARRTMGDLPSLRALVLNAGSGRWDSLEETTVPQWRATIGTNLDGAFHTLRHSLPLLRRHPRAQIIGIGSDSGLEAMPSRAAYCASKAGFASLLETVRAEAREDGVRVSLLAPSRVDTWFGGRSPGERRGALTADDLADLVAFVLALPARVEIREVQLAAITSTYRRLPEHAAMYPARPRGPDGATDLVRLAVAPDGHGKTEHPHCGGRTIAEVEAGND